MGTITGFVSKSVLLAHITFLSTAGALAVPEPTCAIAPLSTGVCVGASATFTVTPSGGVEPYTIRWLGPGGLRSTDLTITISNAQPINAGFYQAMIQDASGSTATCMAQLNVFPEPTCVITPATNRVGVGEMATFSVTAAAGTPPYRVTWTGPGNFTSTNATITISNAQPASEGLYVAVVTDANGCATTCPARLIVSSTLACDIVPPSAAVCEASAVIFTVGASGGTPPYTIRWTGPGEFTSTSPNISFSNARITNAGVYTAMITDAAGSTNICQARLDVFPKPTCTVNPPLAEICAGSSQSFTATPAVGTPPFRLNWIGPGGFTSANATITINNAAIANAGSYVAVMTDANGCVTSCSGLLIVNSKPICAVTPLSTQICAGASLTLTAAGLTGAAPFNFAWTGPGGFTATGSSINIPSVTASAEGTYVVSVTDANGCTNVCSSSVRVIDCDATVRVTKEIVCSSSAGCLEFTGADSATSIRASEHCPAFCYRITIANTSRPGVALQNLSVTDTELDLSGCNFPTALGPVGTAEASVTCLIPNVTHCQSTTNEITVQAVGVLVGTEIRLHTAQASSSAAAEVVPIAVVCDAFVSSQAEVDLDDGPSVVMLPEDTASPVTFGVAISNASPLPVVVFVSAPALDNCPLPAEFTNGVSLAAGETRFWPSLCVAELQCGDVAVAISVEAIVDTALTNLCAYARDGAFVTASNSCAAIVRCTRLDGCRVTGGGRQDATTSRSSFVFPRQGGIDCMSDLAIRHVTHGGQVGGRPMEFDPDSDCIQGNWEHVRHAQGGRRANFHARSFDSLMCVPPNKIAFSGVGDYTCSKGSRKPRSVLFRVDIEGRARHSVRAGRYRIRIWVLTAEELAALSGSANALDDPFLCNFRRAIAATRVNTPLTDGAVTASGAAVSLGTAVFGVRPPDVDDGGEMLHGNHQIHPQTQECIAPVNICPVTP